MFVEKNHRLIPTVKNAYMQAATTKNLHFGKNRIDLERVRARPQQNESRINLQSNNFDKLPSVNPNEPRAN